jgi:hypothetical protein
MQAFVAGLGDTPDRATSVGILFEDVSGRSAHALAERQLRKPASLSERYRKEKGGNSEARTESAGAPLGGQRETKTIP